MRPVLRWVAGAAVVGIGASVGAVALADGGTTGRYRVATAAVGDVAQTVSTNGTVDFVHRADASFPIGGTLSALLVHQGQRVRAGQRLATLDSAALRADVDAAEADLAAAKATLETDQQRQADAVDTDDSAAQPADDSTARMAKQQQAVRAAQTAAGKTIAAAKAALAAQAKACAAKPTAKPTAKPAAKPAADGTALEPGCAAALATAMTAQHAVATAQDALQQRIAELAGTLSAASEVDAPDAKPDGADQAPTAATIATDQAAVDAAAADLLSANQSLAQATLTAPIAGTVASVAVAAGGTVTAGSAVVVLIGAGAAVVETTVPVERIGEVETGQRATVTPSGSPDGVAGTVTRIGRLPDDTADTADAADSVAYPVTVTVDDPPATMPAGSTAGVDIVVAAADGVLTVPTSAVHGGTTVTVLAGTATSPRQVVLGAIGPLRTEIRGGLDRGEQVVLADLDAPLPSAGDQSGPGFGGPGGVVVKNGGPPVRIGR
jgi:multidrug efflux pump subunit AcrA (membrane-fusion protein)